MTGAPNDDGRVLLRATALSKRFNGVVALDGVDLELASGETIGLLGPNGSGKTTLVNCLSGVLKPSGGEIGAFGLPVTRLSRARRARIGLIRTYQNLRLFPSLTVAENVASGIAHARLPKNERRGRIWEQLEALSLTDVAERAVGTLAYGVQKRTEVARALVSRPRVLLLDEPAAGLGAKDADDLAATIEASRDRLGFGVLLIDHNVAFVTRLASRLMVLASGRIIRAGTVAEVMGDAEVAKIYLGEPAHD